MQTTTNLGLKKPESNEYVNVNDINDNSDTLDKAVAARVESSGGNISETVIETLESIDTKYPVPSDGEKVKTFFGKILTFMKNIRPLTSDVTLYVATTGSDIAGDGTSAKPFKTIQYAINTLPKDLGGFYATVNIASGTYDEVITAIGFVNGQLQILSDTKNTINNTCKVRSMVIKYNSAYVMINGFTLTDNIVQQGIVIWSSRAVWLYYCQSTFIAQKLGIYYGESAGIVSNCKFSGKEAVLQIVNSYVLSQHWHEASTGNVEPLQSVSNSVLTKAGLQPSGTGNSQKSYNGGMIVNENGTQISGMISSGISCTWGTSVTGGYIIHGNLNGVAMVTIQIHVAIVTPLTAGSTYLITGFPQTPSNICVTASPQNYIGNCWLDTLGRINLTPSANFVAGQAISFNCTYLTNS